MFSSSAETSSAGATRVDSPALKSPNDASSSSSPVLPSRMGRSGGSGGCSPSSVPSASPASSGSSMSPSNRCMSGSSPPALGDGPVSSGAASRGGGSSCDAVVGLASWTFFAAGADGLSRSVLAASTLGGAGSARFESHSSMADAQSSRSASAPFFGSSGISSSTPSLASTPGTHRTMREHDQGPRARVLRLELEHRQRRAQIAGHHQREPSRSVEKLAPPAGRLGQIGPARAERGEQLALLAAERLVDRLGALFRVYYLIEFEDSAAAALRPPWRTRRRTAPAPRRRASRAAPGDRARGTPRARDGSARPASACRRTIRRTPAPASRRWRRWCTRRDRGCRTARSRGSRPRARSCRRDSS